MRQAFRKIGGPFEPLHPVNQHPVCAERSDRLDQTLSQLVDHAFDRPMPDHLHGAALDALFQAADADPLTLRQNRLRVLVEPEIDPAFPPLETL